MSIDKSLKKDKYFNFFLNTTKHLLSKCLCLWTILRKNDKMSIMQVMYGITVSEMADKLKLPIATVKKRLLRARRKPFSQEALYTEEDFEAIRSVPGKGRPRKTAEPAKPEAKSKKAKK